MRFRLIIAIIFALLLVVFSLQNAEIVDVKLWFWNVKIPRALLILISIAAGVILGMLFSRCKNHQKINRYKS